MILRYNELILNFCYLLILVTGKTHAAPNQSAGLASNSGTSASTMQSSSTEDEVTDTPLPWLDEVRAQRKLLDQQHRAVREAAHARIRITAPWAADQIDEATQKAERYREESQQWAAQRRRSAELKHQAQQEVLERILHYTNPLGSLPYLPYPLFYPYYGPWWISQ